MATTRPSEGTKLYIKVATVYTLIGNIEEIDGPELSVAAVKKTNLSSDRHQYRKSRLVDPGKLTFKLQFDPDDTVHQSIEAHMANPTAADDDFKVEFVDDMVVPAHVTFFGFFTKFKTTGMKIEENLMADCEIQVNSLPVYTPGAAS